MVITSRTRNAVGLRATWVRIPPSPPTEKRTPLGVRFFRYLNKWIRTHGGFTVKTSRRRCLNDPAFSANGKRTPLGVRFFRFPSGFRKKSKMHFFLSEIDQKIENPKNGPQFGAHFSEKFKNAFFSFRIQQKN